MAIETSRHQRTCGPVFVAGPDRSGTTLLFALLASHPDLSMARRTNMWRYFHGRYGELHESANLERCLDDMIGFRRMRHLAPDRARILREFAHGPASYGRLFALLHEHQAERAGKSRWGDKSLHTEHYVERLFAEFPDACVVHLVRDPRDRYASVRRRHGQDLSRVGAATGRWLSSTRAAVRNAARHPDRYLVVRYEDLARDPEATLRRVCDFVALEYSPEMLAMAGAPDHRTGGNSSFGDLEHSAVSTRAIGRFRTALTPSEIAFVQLVARRELAAHGYQPVDAGLRGRARIRFWAWELPVQAGRMTAARIIEWRRRRSGVPVSAPKERSTQ